MKNVKQFQVYPKLPKNLKALEYIAYNIMWTWDSEIVFLFLRLDRDLWEETRHNPVKMLGSISQEKLEQLSKNDSFVAHVNRSKEKIEQYLKAETWFQKTYNGKSDIRISYFSLEFGITECMQVYSGGLGILAGDHLKSSSELGLPLVGVGLLYQEGYFRQYLNIDGWQQEKYPKNDFHNLPVKIVRNKDDTPVRVSVNLPGREVLIQVWKAQIGRIPLYLLDTNIPENNPEDRKITYKLYGGGKETRIQQEIMLGIGGLRALGAVGIKPDVCHMNEGHAAFLTLEKLRQKMIEGSLKPYDAMSVVKAGCAFTTHTPVPAGIDSFSTQLMTKYFSEFAKEIKLPINELLAIGRLNGKDSNEEFNMAYLAMRLSSYCNGVSKLHSKVSKKMWNFLWAGVPEHEVPITHVTNGIHARSWISFDMAGLFDRYLGSEWIENPSDQTTWENIDQIPPEELWRTHERRRERLVAFARRKLCDQLIQRGVSTFQIKTAKEALDPNALTIGFARRFATYKRATLLFRDIDRLKNLILSKDRPVQFIFAGKAHPKDEEGKKLIKEIIHFSRDIDIRRNIVFLEDYDIIIARYMVSGVDVWLNTPRRPMEASGTSGMKAMVNGVLNCSVMDGWWAEACKMGDNVGWTIGKGETYDDNDYQDQVESNALYNLLENEIVPLFYTRGVDRIPWEWISKMKESMRVLSPVFNTNRMIRQYTEEIYMPAAERFRDFSRNEFSEAKEYRGNYDNLSKHWHELEIVNVEADSKNGIDVNSYLEVHAEVKLGSLNHDQVDVQIYFGSLDTDRNIVDGKHVSMEFKNKNDEISHFTGKIASSSSGLHGYTIRILPKYGKMVNPFEWYLINWF